MQIKAVTFDVGGTLLRPWPSVGHIYAEVAARHGHKELSPEALNTRFKAAWRSQKDFNHSREGWAQLVEETFRGLLTHPSATFFPELYERFANCDAWRIFDDVLPTLDALASRDIRLGVISNWDERLRGLLRDFDLEKYFEAIVVSCEVGFPKPSPVIFEHAATKLGIPAEGILHVGDDLITDVQGARTAGFHALRINRSTAPPDGDLHSLAQISAIIGKSDY